MTTIDTEKIRTYIQENQLSKTEFCKRCGFSIQTLSKILSGDLNIMTSTLFRIVKGMKLNHVIEILKK